MAGVLVSVLLAACQGGPAVMPAVRDLGSALGLAVQAKPVPMPAIAGEILSPNVEPRPANTPIRCIVLHHTASKADALAIGKWFANPESKVSAHYVVDRSGAIIRCVKDGTMAHHAGVSEFGGVPNVNQFSIGIEICNIGDNIEPYPKAEVDAVVKLTAALASAYKVPISGITRHRDIARPVGRKDDTSNNFSLAYVQKAVQAMLNGRQPEVYQAEAAPKGYDINDQHYVVEAGDTWESIADRVYDAEAMAPAVRRMNPGVTLQPGVTLAMPVTHSL